MKQILTIILILTALNSKADYWTQKADFGGIKRYSAFAFSVGAKGYVGSGVSTLNSTTLKDFWEYDQSSNTWTQKADFGGAARWNAIGLSILNKGYAGLGIDSAGNALYDFWEYTPVNNVWIQKLNCPTSGLRLTAFSIDSLGYISQTTPASLYQFDPLLNQWSQKTFFNAGGRQDAVSFSIGKKGYFGTGWFPFLQDFWEYDPMTDSWTQKSDVPNPVRGDAAGFSIAGKGYIGTGEGPNTVTYLDDFWQFDPLLNQWNQKASFPGTPRDETIYFAIGNKGYIGLGGHDNISQYLCLDFWEYTPDSSTSVQEIDEITVNIVPNPFLTCTIIKIEKELRKGQLKLYDANGREVAKINDIKGNKILVERGNLEKGIYIYQVMENSTVIASGQIVVQ